MLTKPCRLYVLVVLIIIEQLLAGCYVFRNRDTGSEEGGRNGNAVIGQSLGGLAGTVDEAALADIRNLEGANGPAAVRPDPDRFARRLLLQYRSEGSTVAQQIGSVEQYRLMLGGATEDFSKAPQLTYDATSLLAAYSVAETLCEALVAPDPREHGSWTTILPGQPDDITANLRFLAARMLGKPSSSIDSSVIDSLQTILNAGTESELSYSSYIVPCAALLSDAEAMLL